MTDHDVLTLLKDAAADVAIPEFPRAEVLARGRSLRRRKRTATVLGAGAAASVVVATGIFVPAWLGSTNRAVTLSPEVGNGPGESVAPADLIPQPPSPDRPITVAATDIPSAVQSLFPAGNLGTIVHDDQHVIVDSDTERMVSFMFDGALTEVIIQAAQAGKTCQELNDPAPNRSHCVVSGGLETLIWPPAGPRTSGVMVWQHGYRISAYVFAETAGASGNGSSGSASQPIPGLDTANLIRLASNQVWFD